MHLEVLDLTRCIAAWNVWTTSTTIRSENGDGAPPVELIDGDRLCDLLREFGLGVMAKQRIEEDMTVVESFFDEYD